MARTDDKPFDVIVVLGAAVRPGGAPSAAMRRRVAEGVRLLRQGRAPALLLSGGQGNGKPSEAALMRELALAAGVPEERLVLEAESRSTLENARHSARLMRRCGWSSALIVSDPLHLPRALMAFRAVGIGAAAAPAPGGLREEPVSTWPYHLAREAIAFLYSAALIAARRHRQTSAR